MKKNLLAFAFSLSVFSLSAQMVNDTVSLSPTYANQSWYSLESGNKGSAPKNNWDLAFEISGFGTSVHINSINGTMLWTYPNGAIDAFATADTAGITGWTPQYNSDTSWVLGAFDRNMVLSNANDVGWGVYNPITHNIIGDSLFIIKLANGDYKKIAIESVIGGGYNFKYANIDGSNEVSHFISKSSFSGKNFGYYSLQNDSELDREPVASVNWDLLFTQYTAFIPVPYTVAGVLLNKGVRAVKVAGVGDVDNYNDWFTHNFETPINIIGSDWKSFTGGAWEIQDSLLYFVKSKNGDIWKVVFTGFGGSATGNYIFKKEKLSTTGINDADISSSVSISVYPNPANSENVYLICNFENNFSNASYTIYDLSGRAIENQKISTQKGMNVYNINSSVLSSGVYLLSINVDGKIINQKLIKN
ncbi:MAG: T9SS type A sorting domain-containing protein [Bacteroidia bacterium]|nr:T9SS type A sorting domain-containing protein [Bacteroidia bacterium]MCZ2249055.1 T9SS type A sorting domain-containing protein [Bacteroidia bacterium]